MTAIIDTDFLLAQLLPEDTNYERAIDITSSIEAGYKGKDTIYLPIPILSEFTTITTIKAGMAHAHKATEVYSQMYSLLEITAEMAREAIALLQKQTSKENSLFDCYVIVAAQHLWVDCVLSFDSGYKQNGLMLYSDYAQKYNKIK